MLSSGMLRLILKGGLILLAFAESSLGVAPLPDDPLEMVTSQVQPVAVLDRQATLLRLRRTRENYALRTAGRAYDLKVSFTVNSGGQTKYDGAWKMEDVFDPNRGFRWTANASDAYAITRISSGGMLYGEQTADDIPLRLQEARAALFDPIPSAESLTRASIRTSTVSFRGAQLTCILLSGPGNAAAGEGGRRWDETEECFDPQSGLLQLHSQVPGRYFAYDYSNAPQLAGRVLPRRVTVTEAGKTITEISVDSLTELSAADPSLFVPTAEMKARGRPIAMGGAQKVWRASERLPLPPGANARTICVFGLVTASGQLVEAHSLQPSDPNSQAALEAAQKINFSRAPRLRAHPQQYFVFVIRRFVSSP
ncbi:MAG TPA: hypothetical protein VFA33_04425 [Bryobacteraceae bacterium]|nr:hypothetical protein [Bryobacteraceae bacterium]